MLKCKQWRLRKTIQHFSVNEIFLRMILVFPPKDNGTPLHTLHRALQECSFIETPEPKPNIFLRFLTARSLCCRAQYKERRS